MTDKSKRSITLYDPESVLDIRRDVADGFLILLSGGQSSAAIIKSRNNQIGGKSNENEKKKMTPEQLSSLQLAFAAITDGNVMDTLFGAHIPGGVYKSKDTSAKAFSAAKAVKKALVHTAEKSASTPKAGQEPFIKIAVETYCKCFEIAITYRIYVDEMSTLTWCWRHQKARQDAENALEEAFQPLYEAMGLTPPS